MPAAFIHDHIAVEALARAELPDWWTQALRPCYQVGAQGPDPLFYYHILPPRRGHSINALGSAMHSKHVGEMLSALLAQAQAGRPAVKAWFLGFVTHYAVDTALHPFVYAHSFMGGKYLTRLHLSLEKAMDTWLYRELGNIGIPRHMQAIGQMKRTQKKAISAAIAGMAAKVYPEYRATAEQVEQAFDGALRVNRFLYSPRGIAYASFAWLGRRFGQEDLIVRHMVPRDLPPHDFLNVGAAAWRSPWQNTWERRESLMELLEQARARASAFLRTVLAFYDGKLSLEQTAERLGDMHFSSGLPWQETPQMQAEGQE